MRTNKNLLTVTVIIIFFIIIISTFTSIQGSSRIYEVQPYINIPEYRINAGRAIDAYERLMERYMDLVEKNITDINVDIEKAIKKLDSIDENLINLSAKTSRIEKALGIEQPIKPSVNTQKENNNHKQEQIGQ
jgi:hypothetical protein